MGASCKLGVSVHCGTVVCLSQSHNVAAAVCTSGRCTAATPRRWRTTACQGPECVLPKEGWAAHVSNNHSGDKQGWAAIFLFARPQKPSESSPTVWQSLQPSTFPCASTWADKAFVYEVPAQGGAPTLMHSQGVSTCQYKCFDNCLVCRLYTHLPPKELLPAKLTGRPR